ncbi:MAG TPA: hypothetical protein VMH88_12410 [Gemmatimonadales bacterium]|nr:hypothetical protein [Gemmatimonadales bacterium]
MSDRALQDRVIRALADAPFRASAAWRGEPLADPDRVERFAHFLARHFYYERIHHFFRYSRALARITRRAPDAVLAAPGFEALFPTLVLGSRASAEAVARLVVQYVGSGEPGVAYHADLLRYEQAMMLVESGPRVWRDGELGDGRGERSNPVMVAGTVLLDLDYDLPAVLAKLVEPWTEVPACPRKPTRLVVARSRHGRVSVARTTVVIDTIMQLADGRKNIEDLAAEAGLRPEELAATLQGLVELGAVRFSTGS